MSSTVAKLLAAGLAIAAIGLTAVTSDKGDDLLFTIAGGLVAGIAVGKEFFSRVGDRPRETHPDDLSIK